MTDSACAGVAMAERAAVPRLPRQRPTEEPKFAKQGVVLVGKHRVHPVGVYRADRGVRQRPDGVDQRRLLDTGERVGGDGQVGRPPLPLPRTSTACWPSKTIAPP
jgi:hypothetical protein